jgi:glycine C-acetyltransferase
MGISITEHLQQQLDEIRAKGLYKAERVITTPQDAHIRVGDGQSVLNMCANNYLGLAEHPAVIQAAHEGLDRWGYGLSSVRFICGTQAVHKQLEAKISEFLGTEDTILYTLSTVCGSAKHSDSATRTTTWPTWKSACARPATPGTG